MKYVKGSQVYKLDDLKLCKIRLVREDCGEGIWVRQADGEVILQNQALAFLPYVSWGTVFKSKYNTGSTSNTREEIDVTKMCLDDMKDCTLTIHPDVWNSYIEEGIIDNDGSPLKELD